MVVVEALSAWGVGCCTVLWVGLRRPNLKSEINLKTYNQGIKTDLKIEEKRIQNTVPLYINTW